MILDLRKGFGDFPEYKLFKFPDSSIKFELKSKGYVNRVIITLRSSDDILTLNLVKNTLDNGFINLAGCSLDIMYMMYQQDDRKFKNTESFGLKVICNFINSMNWKNVTVFHPHSDKVEFINNCNIIDNTQFIEFAIGDFMLPIDDPNYSEPYWVVPDAGAFKTQFKQIQHFSYKDFISCSKSRDFKTGDITTIVNCENLEGRDCFIIDDICLGGNTFINIAKILKQKNCGKIYLIVSHGLFNQGVEHLYSWFNCIYTTDSICKLEESKQLKIFQL